MSYRIETMAGALAPIAVIATLVLLAFVTWSTSESCTAIAAPGGAVSETCTTTHEHLVDQPVRGLLIGGAVVVTLAASIAGGAWWHARTGSRVARTLLWAATAVAVVITFLSMASIGIFFLPAMLCGIVASIAATGDGGRPALEAPRGGAAG
jgi:hypothetical protein